MRLLLATTLLLGACSHGFAARYAAAERALARTPRCTLADGKTVYYSPSNPPCSACSVVTSK